MENKAGAQDPNTYLRAKVRGQTYPFIMIRRGLFSHWTGILYYTHSQNVNISNKLHGDVQKQEQETLYGLSSG